jgi:hypothetical protein
MVNNVLRMLKSEGQPHYLCYNGGLEMRGCAWGKDGGRGRNLRRGPFGDLCMRIVMLIS